MSEDKDAKDKDTETLARPVRAVEFVVEIGDKLNGSHIWPMNQRTLRGTWRNDNVRHLGLDTEDKYAVMRQMRDMPGMCIQVNTRRRTARIFDPLGEPINKELLAHHVSIQKQTEGKTCGPDKPEAYEDLSADEIKTWLYWCRRKLDARQCREVSGSVPEMSEIMSMPGERIRNTSDDNVPDDQRYRPMVHADA